ncbi:Aminopeptidase S [Kocuria rosea]|uniref:M28 family peptidase n=1 Tax=Kocuria rosea TaxID=1275 RepID=UPI000F6F9D5A|nr:M28 family peptidase [Kocuria rosea]VEH43946.1 Aminopeptidase S [Kocuria rosea]
MRRRAFSRGFASVVLAVVLSLTAGGPAAALPAGPDGATSTEGITEAVTAEQLEGHLQAFRDAADAHGGNRAVGTDGYRASVDYVVERLQAAGYDLRVQVFTVPGDEDHDDDHDEDSATERRVTYNVLADTATGDPDSTVLVGAHLDSVPEGPGLSDNGSGAAGVLAVAEALAGTDVQNRVRFAWWGAEELNLNGADHYVSDLRANDPGAFEDIAMYLNFDMIGSPNYGRFVYDGDASGSGWHGDSVEAPDGSDAIEAAFEGYFESVGIAADEVPLDDGSDHLVFAGAGIPVGGLFTGDTGEKTRREAARYGGEAGADYDPCYHSACDDLDNVDLQVLEEMSDATAAVVLGFASSTIDDGAPLRPPDGWPRRGALEELGPVLVGLAVVSVLVAAAVAAAVAVRRRARGRR